MTMFEQLYALAKTATLSMIISADDTSGKMTISIAPKPKKDTGEAALTKDLTLTATPAEFDADFIAALTGYREKRQSLIEQADATNEVLNAAKAASAKKATDAVTKASKTTDRKASVASESLDDDDEGAGGDEHNNSQPTKISNAPAAQDSGNGELNLFG